MSCRDRDAKNDDGFDDDGDGSGEVESLIIMTTVLTRTVILIMRMTRLVMMMTRVMLS